MQNLILTLHIIVCVLLVILVLLQSGKEGMGVIFGGGNSSVFGSTGAGGILAKLTTLMAIIFVITSLSYTYVTSTHEETESQVINVQLEETPPQVPVTTETPPKTDNNKPAVGGVPADAAPAEPEKPAPPSTTAPTGEGAKSSTGTDSPASAADQNTPAQATP